MEGGGGVGASPCGVLKGGKGHKVLIYVGLCSEVIRDDALPGYYRALVI